MTCTLDLAKGRVLCTGDPEQRWIAQMAAQAEAAQRAHELAQDVAWEYEQGLRDEVAHIEFVETELLPEVQRMTEVG